MSTINSISKKIKALSWIFLVVGFIEFMICIFISRMLTESLLINILSVIPAFVTIFSSYYSCRTNSPKRGYFIGIWAILKYNPIILMLITFVTSDILSSIDLTFSPFIVNFILIIGLISFILGVLFIIYIFKFNKIQKIAVVNNSIEKHKKNSQEIHQVKLSSSDALNKLKEAKQKLDLELISQEQYNVIKEELRPFIN